MGPLLYAGIAQLVEQLIRNEQVAGSSPITSSKSVSQSETRDVSRRSGIQRFCKAKIARYVAFAEGNRR